MRSKAKSRILALFVVAAVAAGGGQEPVLVKSGLEVQSDGKGGFAVFAGERELACTVNADGSRTVRLPKELLTAYVLIKIQQISTLSTFNYPRRVAVRVVV